MVNLERGEAEAIALALQKKDTLLILDDKKARGIAEALGLRLTGTIGIMVKAKEKRLLKSVKEVLEALEGANFRVSKGLRDKALKLAKEE